MFNYGLQFLHGEYPSLISSLREAFVDCVFAADIFLTL